MAMDYLPVQATSVPCERVFSSAKETDTDKRNRMSPVLMEALQLLKFSLKKERLNFTAGWATSESTMGVVHKPRPSLADALFMCNTEHRDATLDDVLNELDVYDGNSCPYPFFLIPIADVRWFVVIRSVSH